ncbi:microcompartment protein [Thermacetogenium phaeum DSM 12270]|uniref:Microcompartment protein n=1 Tax=Thermacetogenium phaeum (strain ATCC BAA-254 / DSM 26808 / PB) TaxID=1089553 RepID=K4LD95_THEPS|nr:BMC domain-containing protein [Thermacetogenium phaeum]AFV10936.1 microcompartment protein [Thermacetogenium phaeum DSM 12270]
MITAIGLVEFQSIAKGIEGADAMVKAGRVELVLARPICPGKYIALVEGDVAAVRAAVDAGIACGEEMIVDTFVIPNIHSLVLKGLYGQVEFERVDALGIIETFSVASLIEAADAAVKTADVRPLEIRLAVGVGGKSYVVITGDVAAVESAVRAGADVAAQRGLLVKEVVIPGPASEIKKGAF